MNRALIVSCEHAGNKIPSKYRYLFKGRRGLLETHRGYDIGARDLTETISSRMNIRAYSQDISRLLIDLNRSLDNPSVFSDFVSHLDEELRESLVREYYLPYRKEITNAIRVLVAGGTPVLHLSVHTFTPVLHGEERDTDVGILFDPGRKLEEDFGQRWVRELKAQLPYLNYRMNYPYLGTMDGFTTTLRKNLSEDEYLGIELEVSQRFTEPDRTKEWAEIQEGIVQGLKEAVGY
ncbi:MAG: N-formylglutamate amidohydrolase [Chloroflexota bacterium]|nr:N-formylglutamate amidohydrolase [Chloroflexota bacterium]